MTGKLIGFMIGLMITGSPFGAIVGLFVGHSVDKAMRRSLDNRSSPFTPDLASQTQFLHATYSVMGHLSKAKGQVTAHDINLATEQMNRMNLTGDMRQRAQDAFREGKHPDFPLIQILGYLKQNCARRIDLLNFFLDLQIQIAFNDGTIHPKERDILFTIAKTLGFSETQLAQHLQMQEAAYRFRNGHFYQQSQQQRSHYERANNNYQQQRQQNDQQQSNGARLNDAYKILGLTEKASLQDVKKAYRKLMNEHHPDKLMAKGLPPEMMEMAKEKTQEIQAAYDMINKALKD